MADINHILVHSARMASLVLPEVKTSINGKAIALIIKSTTPKPVKHASKCNSACTGFTS